jgi:hypothetical protein
MSEERKVQRISRSQPTLEGAGVYLHRALGFDEVPIFDPCLLLDDFRIYARDLSPAEIASVMLSEAPVISRFGAGSPGPTGQPTIGANGPPHVPNPGFMVRLRGGEPFQPSFLSFGFAASQWKGAPLPLDLSGMLGPGSALHVAPIQFLALSTGSGDIDLPVAIGPVPAFKGVHCYAQWLILGSTGAVTSGIDLNFE